MARKLVEADKMASSSSVAVVLFLGVAAIAYAMLSSIAVFVNATEKRSSEKSSVRLMRLFSGWANASNGVVHLLLIIYMLGNGDDPWVVKELEEGLAGPVGLMLINATIGLLSINGGGVRVPLGWNCFVAVVGSLIPMVWPRFLSVGLAAWPPIAIFIWLCIFAFELTACCASVTWYALVKA